LEKKLFSLGFVSDINPMNIVSIWVIINQPFKLFCCKYRNFNYYETIIISNELYSYVVKLLWCFVVMGNCSESFFSGLLYLETTQK
jgi:hypothetical protein